MGHRNSDNHNKTRIGILVVLCAVVLCGVIVSQSKTSFHLFQSVDVSTRDEGEPEEYEAVRYKAGDPKKDDTVLDKTTAEPSPTPEPSEYLDPPEDDDLDDAQADPAEETDDGNTDADADASDTSATDDDSSTVVTQAPSVQKTSVKKNNSEKDSHTPAPKKTPGKTAGTTPRPHSTKAPEASLTPQPSASVQPAVRHITGFTVTGTLPQDFPVGHKVSAEDFKNVTAIASWSDGRKETVVYGMYQVEIDCSSATGDAKRQAVFTYQGIRAAETIPYGVVQYTVTLLKTMQIPKTTSALTADGKETSIPAKTFGSGSYTLLADGSKTVDLRQSFSNYIREINADKKHGFYLTYQREDGTSVYNFAGWEDENGVRYTTSYTMKSGQNATLHPVFEKTGESYGEQADPEDYIIASTEDGENVLVGYRGTDPVLNVPAGVTKIDFEKTFTTWGKDTPAIDKICIPDSVTSVNLEYDASDAEADAHLRACGQIEVSEENDAYSSTNGVLYNKAGTLLLKVPYGMTDMPEWNTACTGVASLAFSHTSIHSLVIPEQVKAIAADGTDSFTTPDGALTSVVIKAAKDLTLGKAFFDGESSENSRSYMFQTTTPFTLDLSEKGALPVLYVPDSADDEVYTDYLCSLGAAYTKAVKARGEEKEVTDYIMTAGGAQRRHTYDAAQKAVWSLQEEGRLERAAAGGRQTINLADYGDVRSLGANVFRDAGKTRILQIPASVEKISANALGGMKNLRLIQMDSAVPAQIGSHAFGDDLDREFYVRIPDSEDKTVINTYLGQWKEQIDSDYGNGTARRILGVGDLSYYQEEDGVRYLIHENGEQELIEVVDKSIQKLVLPENTTAIAAGALKGCSDLEIVCLPEKLRYLGSDLFEGCQSLRLITVNGADIQTETDTFRSIDRAQVCVAVPTTQRGLYEQQWKSAGLTYVNYGERYEMADDMIYADSGEGRTVFYTAYYKKGTQSYRAVAPDQGALILTAGHCSGRTGITEVNLDAANMILAPGNFNGCTGVTDVTFSSLPKEWGGSLFGGSGVQNIKIMAGGKNLSLPEAFVKNCTSLVSVRVEGNVQSGSEIVIPDNCFDGCSNLRLFDIVERQSRDAVTEIGADSFRGCSSLTSITIGRKVTQIKKNAFRDCRALQSVNSYSSAISGETFADSENLCLNYFAAELKPGMFAGFTGLSAFNLYTESGKMEIPDQCFRGCTNLRSVDIIHRGVLRKIGDRAFAQTSLLAMEIPESVETIGDGAFDGCPLTTLTFEAGEKNVPELGTKIFGDAGTIDDSFVIRVPENTEGVYWKAWNHRLDADYPSAYAQGQTARWLRYTVPVTEPDSQPDETAVSAPENTVTPAAEQTPDSQPKQTTAPVTVSPADSFQTPEQTAE